MLSRDSSFVVGHSKKQHMFNILSFHPIFLLFTDQIFPNINESYREFKFRETVSKWTPKDCLDSWSVCVCLCVYRLQSCVWWLKSRIRCCVLSKSWPTTASCSTCRFILHILYKSFCVFLSWDSPSFYRDLLHITEVSLSNLLSHTPSQGFCSISSVALPLSVCLSPVGIWHREC